MSLSDEDDKTVIRPVAKPHTSLTAPLNHAEQHDQNVLPIGCRIAEFEIKELIGIGGFGIVYLAHDHSLGRDVALKEYMPSSLASRTDGVTVTVKSQRHAETFTAGMNSFINEARLLAKFDNSSLVKAYRFWEANGTAYMVMPFYRGLTLKQTLQEMQTPPSEEWLRELIEPLMDALQLIHQENIFHRDIAPDNILLLKSGQPVLLDFGAARQVIGDLAKTLTVILKPGYAPIEQYADVPDMKQGAWTDIYALAAVVHYAITGKAPTPSVGRVMNDSNVSLETAAAGRYSNDFLRAIDKALAVRPENRPQSIGELRNLLGFSTRKPEKRAQPLAIPANGHPATVKENRNKGLLAGIAIAGVAIALGTYFILSPDPDTPTAKSPTPLPRVDSSAVTVDTAVAVRPSASIDVPKQSAEGQEFNKSINGQPDSSGAQWANQPSDSAKALHQLFERRSLEHIVNVSLDKTEVKIGKDELRFRIQTVKSGFLYIFMVGTDRAHVNLLFPNKLDKNNKILAGQAVKLPKPGWLMVAGGPPGKNEFVAMVSEHPRDFTVAGLKKEGFFWEFILETAAKIQGLKLGDTPVLAGKPTCAAGVDCSDVYGAATFTITEVK